MGLMVLLIVRDYVNRDGGSEDAVQKYNYLAGALRSERLFKSANATQTSVYNFFPALP
jgi:hypothetical protein